MRHNELKPRFVKNNPDKIEEGILYISMKYRSAVHRCACGCGNITELIIGPKNWKIIYDGTVTIDGSIGNNNYPCKAHYLIVNNKIIWCTDEKQGHRGGKKK